MENQRLDGYRCSECGRLVGLMADKDGKPVYFKCIYTNRVAQLQVPIRRDTPPLPKEQEPPVITVRRWMPEDDDE